MTQPAAPTTARNSAEECAVWDAVDDAPTAFEMILFRTDLSVTAAATACDHLVESGVLLAGSGWWSWNSKPSHRHEGSSRPRRTWSS